MNKILKNKWHLHSLTFTLVILFLTLTDSYPSFMSIGETGNFLQGFLAVLSSSAAAFGVEWVEGYFFGANRTPEQGRESDLDIFVSIAAGCVGLLIYFLFPTVSLKVGIIFAVVVGVLEICRRMSK